MIAYTHLTGRLVMTDNAADPIKVIFDTQDEQMLSVSPDDVHVGSKSLPIRTASSEGVNGAQIVVDYEQEYYLATLDIPGANVVRGMMRVTWDSDPEPADNLWRQAGGTNIDLMDGVSLTTVPQSDLGGYNRVAAISGYTIYVNALGELTLNERLVMRARDRGSPPAGYRYRRPCTISFRLLVGCFLGADYSVKPGVVYRGYTLNSGSASYSFPMYFGAAFTGRRCVVIVDTLTAANPTSVTIGGVAATIHHSATFASRGYCVASAIVNSGEDLTVAISFGASRNCFVTAYSAKHAGGTVTVTAGNTSSATTSFGISLTMGADKAAIAYASAQMGTTPPVGDEWLIWSGPPLDRKFLQILPTVAFPHSAAVLRQGVTGTVTPTANVPRSASIYMLGVVFS